MADPDAPEQLIDDVEAAFGPVDILVANHGFARQARFEDVDAAIFDHTLAINPGALPARPPHVAGDARARFGRVLFISSVAAFRGGVIGPDYACAPARFGNQAVSCCSRSPR
jgi:3-oxoacyl-[acyl-carrier protein] reductase